MLVPFTCQTIRETEASHRAYMERSGYPTPPRFDSLVFVLQELAEWVDAKITRQNPAYKRNNAKPVDPEMEMGDLISMTATALLRPSGPAQDDFESDIRDHLSYVLMLLSRCVATQDEGVIDDLLVAIVEMNNATMSGLAEDAQTKAHTKIREKWAYANSLKVENQQAH